MTLRVRRPKCQYSQLFYHHSSAVVDSDRNLVDALLVLFEFSGAWYIKKGKKCSDCSDYAHLPRELHNCVWDCWLEPLGALVSFITKKTWFSLCGGTLITVGSCRPEALLFSYIAFHRVFCLVKRPPPLDAHLLLFLFPAWHFLRHEKVPPVTEIERPRK